MKAFDPQAYRDLWQRYVHGAPRSDVELKYFTYHQDRYEELFGAMAAWLAKHEHPKVLEVGVAAFTPFYRRLFPEITLTTVDRPMRMFGASNEYCLNECGADRHYEADLISQRLSPDFGTPPLGDFDFVICTEVIEHLPVNPVEFIGSLLSLLSAGGHLYLTTPNFFSIHTLGKIARRENPQSVFPKSGDNADAHHHYREYSLPELVQFTREAGGRIAFASYSDCWDSEELRASILARHPAQRGNLQLVAARRDGAGGSDVDAPPFSFDPPPVAPAPPTVPAPGPDWRDEEIARLQALVTGYERGRFMRLMRLLKHGRQRP